MCLFITVDYPQLFRTYQQSLLKLKFKFRSPVGSDDQNLWIYKNGFGLFIVCHISRIPATIVVAINENSNTVFTRRKIIECVRSMTGNFFHQFKFFLVLSCQSYFPLVSLKFFCLSYIFPYYLVLFRRLPSPTTPTNLQPTPPSTSSPTSGQLCWRPATQRLSAGSSYGASNANGSSRWSTSTAAAIGPNASDTANRSAVPGGYHSPSYLAYTGKFRFCLKFMIFRFTKSSRYITKK